MIIEWKVHRKFYGLMILTMEFCLIEHELSLSGISFEMLVCIYCSWLMTIYEKQIICNCNFINRFPYLLPYHGPEGHDVLAEEFLEYQNMPLPPLQHPEEFQIESFWAEMATRKD